MILFVGRPSLLGGGGLCDRTVRTFLRPPMQRVLSKQRMSMNHRRKSSLVQQAYESDVTNNNKLDELVEVFKNKHPRRLNL